MKRSLLSCTLCATALLSPCLIHAAAPSGFTETNYIQNSALNQATGLAWAPDGSNRLFVTGKNGTVRVIQDGALLPTPFAQFPQVHTNSECGLIGICFDPDFLNNGYVYFFVTVSASEQRIVRYTDSNSVGVEPTVIVQRLPTTGNNHDGGAIGIGPDGHLYWGIGDLGNGTGVNADLTSLASKIGRANRFTGAPLNDNPFNDGVGPNNEFIWARGFRNPFTLAFQPRTGALWVNVAGTSYEQAFVVGKGDNAGYSSYENDQPPVDYITPAIAYRTNSIDTRNLTASGTSRTGNVSTFTTVAPHRFRRGAKITIAGVPNASMNGTVYVSEVVSDTVFRAQQPGPDVANSGGGTATTDNIGGSLTGGCFYDSTLFPSGYHGNFFFGDYNTHRIARAQIVSGNQVAQVDSFITEAFSNVDIATGPDGALYYVGFNGGVVKRLVPSDSQQNLVIYPTTVNVQEGGRALFTVRLAQQPVSPITVQIAKQAGGDEDLAASVTTLTFDAGNWNQLQPVEIHAAVDADNSRGSAVFQVSAAGLPEQEVVGIEIEGQAPNLGPTTSLLYRVGDTVPGEPEGTKFTNFGLPSLDGSRVGFLATFRGTGSSQTGILGGTPIGVQIRKGDGAPGTEGIFWTFRDPVFGGGRFAFMARLKTGEGGVASIDNDGIWSNASGSLQLVAREGSIAPGTDEAVFHSFVSLALPETGGAIFIGKLLAGSGSAENTVTTANDMGLWREVNGVATLLLREGWTMNVDGAPLKVRKFQTLSSVSGSQDQRRGHRPDGDVLILISFENGSQAIAEAAVGSSELTLIQATGDAPVLPAGTMIRKLGIPSAGAGAEAFIGLLAPGAEVTSATNTAIFVGTAASGFSARVREGQSAPGTGSATFSGFGVPALVGTTNASVFLGQLRRGSGDPVVEKTNDKGIWYGTEGSLSLVAREGASAPGTAGVFDAFRSFSVHPTGLFARGLAFTARLRVGEGDVVRTNSEGLWVRDTRGTVYLLRRTGDVIPGTTPATVKTISALKSGSRTAAQGRATNADGQIIYRATLGRAGKAIFRVQMP